MTPAVVASARRKERAEHGTYSAVGSLLLREGKLKSRSISGWRTHHTDFSAVNPTSELVCGRTREKLGEKNYLRTAQRSGCFLSESGEQC